MKGFRYILKTMANKEYSNKQTKKGPKLLTVYDIILSSINLVYF